jgi:hypothetical protein
VLFASDGDSLAVASVPRTKGAAFEPIRYLNRVLARVTAGEFEQKVDGFLEGVLSRMYSLGIEGDLLPPLWAEVVAERHDPQAARWRKHIITMPRGLRKRNVYEEVARLLDIPGGEQIVKESYAQMRKFNCWNISIVQQYSRFKESRIRSAVFGNSRQFFLMRQTDRADLRGGKSEWRRTSIYYRGEECRAQGGAVCYRPLAAVAPRGCQPWR